MLFTAPSDAYNCRSGPFVALTMMITDTADYFTPVCICVCAVITPIGTKFCDQSEASFAFWTLISIQDRYRQIKVGIITL